MLQIPGPKLKVNDNVIQVITSAVKSHTGQLVERAKQIQIDEIKHRLAMKYPHKKQQQLESGEQLESSQSCLVNGALLSKEA